MFTLTIIIISTLNNIKLRFDFINYYVKQTSRFFVEILTSNINRRLNIKLLSRLDVELLNNILDNKLDIIKSIVNK